jgi:SAM-dependent methyltransferase
VLDSDQDYCKWRSIDYRPAVQSVEIRSLFEFAKAGMKAIEIGCGTGAVARELLQHGLRVHGIDVNERAISLAKEAVSSGEFRHFGSFQVGDFLSQNFDAEFDVVVAIRVLTCFPDSKDWSTLLTKIKRCIRPNGVIYINDFVFQPDNPAYRLRYAEGKELGWRTGNFPVRDQNGRLLFVAHHHLEDEINNLESGFERLRLRFYESFSMNGNACSMFEFIGRSNQTA